MPATQRSRPVAVVARVLEEPHRFGFFQVLRLLERWMGRQEGLSSAQVLARRVSMRNPLSMSFPASEVAGLDVVHRPGASPGDGAPPASHDIERIELTPAFIGLLGAGGALPPYYTELVAERELYHRDRAARAFLDVFQHRAAVLFYQAWRKHRLPVQFETDRQERYLPLVLALAGVGHSGVRARLQPEHGGVADDALAFFAGTLQRRPLSAVAMQALLARYFDVPIRLEQFVGRWFQLPESNRSRLGLAQMTLGRDLVMGERVWQRDLRMRLVIGPLSRERFERFLPGRPAQRALQELLALLSCRALEFEVRLVLRAADVRGSRLHGASGACLGHDSFLITRAATQDRDDVSYDLFTA